MECHPLLGEANLDGDFHTLQFLNSQDLLAGTCNHMLPNNQQQAAYGSIDIYRLICQVCYLWNTYLNSYDQCNMRWSLEVRYQCLSLAHTNCLLKHLYAALDPGSKRLLLDCFQHSALPWEDDQSLFLLCYILSQQLWNLSDMLSVVKEYSKREIFHPEIYKGSQ